MAIFKPIRGTEEQIKNQPINDGAFYVAKDTSHIYVDTAAGRIQIGGSGASIYYSNEEKLAPDETLNTDERSDIYILDRTKIYSSNPPLEGAASIDNISLQLYDLIINTYDSSLYRIIEIKEENIILAERLLISGTGGSGGISSDGIRPKVINFGSASSFLLVEGGQEYIEIQMILDSEKLDGETTASLSFDVLEMDSDISLFPGTGLQVGSSANNLQNNQVFRLDINLLPKGNYRLKVTAANANAAKSTTRWYTYQWSSFSLLKTSLENFYYVDANAVGGQRIQNFSIKIPEYLTFADSNYKLTLHYSIDNSTLRTRTFNNGLYNLSLSDTNTSADELVLPDKVHNIMFYATAELYGRIITTNMIKYTAAWSTSDGGPLVIFADYPLEILNNEIFNIEYKIVNTQEQSLNLILKHNNSIITQLSNIPVDTEQYWPATDLYNVGKNIFTINYKNVDYSIELQVNESVDQYNLILTPGYVNNYTTKNRFSTDILTRESLKDQVTNQTADFTNFNWYSNGWKEDQLTSENKYLYTRSFLRLSDKAALTLPISINENDNSLNWTFECRFRPFNNTQYVPMVQSTLQYYVIIKDDNDQLPEITSPSSTDKKYKQKDGIYSETSVDDVDGRYYEVTLCTEKELKEINKNFVYIYDAYGTIKTKISDTRTIKLDDVLISCALDNNNNIGIYIGSQEAFALLNGSFVNVRYLDEELITISFVCDATLSLLFIYLNGIYTGATKIDQSTKKIISSLSNQILINSNKCDIDLYDIRFYKKALSWSEILNNYCYDLFDINKLKENLLADDLKPNALSFEKIVSFNTTFNKAIMPYAIWTASTDTRDNILPTYKGDSKNFDIEFVNAPLDKEANEEEKSLEWWIKTYYTMSPSYIAKNVNLDVQGTSSQAYPRRNYKTKFKNAGKTWQFTNGPLKNYPINMKYLFSAQFDNCWQEIKTDTITSYQPLRYNTETKCYEKNGELISEKPQNSFILSKNFHMDNEDLGTNKFTWKIDYMESSGTYNTGLANLASSIYDYHPLREDTFYRTSIYGYPVLVFHKFNINKQGNLTTSTVDSNHYEYIGKYNMNLDKGSNEYYGFEDKDYAEKAQCWELQDNQGTWCSFRYPTGYNTFKNNEYEVLDHFEARYIDDQDNFESKAEGDQNSQDNKDYLYERLQPLEKVFNWLNSTDTEIDFTNLNPISDSEVYDIVFDTQENITSDIIDKRGYQSAEKWKSINPKEQLVEVYNSNEIENYIIYKKNQTPRQAENLEDMSLDQIKEKYFTQYIENNEGNYYYNGKNYEKWSASIGDVIRYEKNETLLTDTYEYYLMTSAGFKIYFEKDTRYYRLTKFKQQFNTYFDKHYCLIYFILTELLMCYDSRGKNMMLATWGPPKNSSAGAPYIWYPIFYDIDTQQGLNNSGAFLWDYDEDVSKNHTFSTSNSVLWNNFYEVFLDDIKREYRKIRKNKLSNTALKNAYLLREGNVFSMKGERPEIIYNLDMYYKYFAIIKEGYYEAQANKLTLDTNATFAYACQGTRELSTQRFLNNRTNYLDSQWLGGDYDISIVRTNEFQCRVNGTTNIIYSDSLIEGAYPSTDKREASPYYTLKPFLKQSVSFFTDEIASEPKIFDPADLNQINGVTVNVAQSIKDNFAKRTAPDQQLNYIPAVDYLISLGDLSHLYIGELNFRKGKRLTDLLLGNSLNGYTNPKLTTNSICELHLDQKPLLQKINLDHIPGFDKSLDLSYQTKLEYFSADGTNISYITFAPGAPLKLVILPEKITTLNLDNIQYPLEIINNNDNGELDKTSGNYQEWQSKNNTKNYLYLPAPNVITNLIVKGNQLGDSLWTNLLSQKTEETDEGTSFISFTSLTLQNINLYMKNIALIDDNTDKYNTFIMRQISDSNTSISFAKLKAFLIKNSQATISGNICCSLDTSKNENLTCLWEFQSAFPHLYLYTNTQAEYPSDNNRAFVFINNNKIIFNFYEEILNMQTLIDKLNNSNFDIPISNNPNKIFNGWRAIINSDTDTDKYNITYNITTKKYEATTTSQIEIVSSILYEAQFTDTIYTINFYDYTYKYKGDYQTDRLDSIEKDTEFIAHSFSKSTTESLNFNIDKIWPITTPWYPDIQQYPYKHTEFIDFLNRGNKITYNKFLGYSENPYASSATYTSVTDLPNPLTRNLNLYPIFKQDEVLQPLTPEEVKKYFYIIPLTAENGQIQSLCLNFKVPYNSTSDQLDTDNETNSLKLKQNVSCLSGKIKIPYETEYNGKFYPIIALQNQNRIKIATSTGTYSTAQLTDALNIRDITHIFFESKSGAYAITKLNSGTFYRAMNLLYLEMPSTLIELGYYSLSGTSHLSKVDLSQVKIFRNSAIHAVPQLVRWSNLSSWINFCNYKIMDADKNDDYIYGKIIISEQLNSKNNPTNTEANSFCDNNKQLLNYFIASNSKGEDGLTQFKNNQSWNNNQNYVAIGPNINKNIKKVNSLESLEKIEPYAIVGLGSASLWPTVTNEEKIYQYCMPKSIKTNTFFTQAALFHVSNNLPSIVHLFNTSEPILSIDENSLYFAQPDTKATNENTINYGSILIIDGKPKYHYPPLCYDFNKNLLLDLTFNINNQIRIKIDNNQEITPNINIYLYGYLFILLKILAEKKGFEKNDQFNTVFNFYPEVLRKMTLQNQPWIQDTWTSFFNSEGKGSPFIFTKESAENDCETQIQHIKKILQFLYSNYEDIKEPLAEKINNPIANIMKFKNDKTTSPLQNNTLFNISYGHFLCQQGTSRYFQWIIINKYWKYWKPYLVGNLKNISLYDHDETINNKKTKINRLIGQWIHNSLNETNNNTNIKQYQYSTDMKTINMYNNSEEIEFNGQNNIDLYLEHPSSSISRSNLNSNTYIYFKLSKSDCPQNHKNDEKLSSSLLTYYNSLRNHYIEGDKTYDTPEITKIEDILDNDGKIKSHIFPDNITVGFNSLYDSKNNDSFKWVFCTAGELYSIVASYAYIFNFSKLWKQKEPYGETDYITSYKDYNTIHKLIKDNNNNYQPYSLQSDKTISFTLTIDENLLYKQAQENDIDNLLKDFSSTDGSLNIKLQSDNKDQYDFYQFSSTSSDNIIQGGSANLSYNLTTQESENATS